MPGTDRVEIYSLGGCGGFGMNSTLYLSGGEGLLVDYGLGLPRGPSLGVSQIVPDPTPLLDRCPRLNAVLLTHAHDDHGGALPFLPDAWRSAPIYGPGLAIAGAKDRFEDAGRPAPKMRSVPPGERLELGRFAATFLHVTHSVPDTRIVALDSPAGLIAHVSDFKLDPTPVRGHSTDLAAIAELGRRGVRLALFDSTGTLRDGRTASERSVVAPLESLIRDCAGQVVVSTFASHLDRIQSLCGIAQRTQRRTATMGMRMTRAVRHGTELGLFDAPAGLIRDRDEIPMIPEQQRLVVAGGCQGERESSLNRISLESEPRLVLGRGDLVIISASVIPGSDINVGRMMDRFLRRGVAVVHAAEVRELHVSGHGAREEIREVLELLRPEAAVPIHGDRTHLEAAARLAEGLDRPPRRIEIAELGEGLSLGPEGLRRAERVELLPRYLDAAGEQIPGQVLKDRYRMSETGAVNAWVVVRDGRDGRPCAEVRIAALGVSGWSGADARGAALEAEVKRRLDRAAAAGTDPGQLEEEAAVLIAASLRAGSRRRPKVVVRLDDERTRA